MSSMTDEWDEIEKSILREALRLGFEVGFRGHIEGVGWVRSKYKELEAEATRLGIIEALVEKYESGKEFGKKKRLSSFISPEGGLVFEKKKPAKLQSIRPKTLPVRVVTDESSKDLIYERVSQKEAVGAISDLMKLAQKNEKFMQRLETIFSSVADIHDRLADLKPVENDRGKTINNGLDILVDLGWLESYDVIEIDLKSKTAKVNGISRIAQAVGQSAEPMCKPICVALETVGNKTFNVSTVVLEKRCMAQGEDKCKFVFVPRPQLL